MAIDLPGVLRTSGNLRGCSAGPVGGWRRAGPGLWRPLGAINVGVHDFVFDTCADGRVLWCLTVADEFARECLPIDVAGGIRSARVIEVLTQLVRLHGASRYLRSDNEPEFVATAILRWT